MSSSEAFVEPTRVKPVSSQKAKRAKRFVMPSSPFHRLVRKITSDMGKQLNFKKDALDAFQVHY
jgi:histone H3/H4